MVWKVCATYNMKVRRPSSLDAVKVVLLKHIQTESVSKISELQQYLKSKHSMEIEHSWLATI